MQQPQSIYGIIGFPLTYTLSPVMHNTAFKELGVNSIYKAFPLKEEDVDDFLKELKEDHNPIFGLNVTVPYKEKAVQYLDVMTPFVERAMAVNTIVINKQRQLVGYNTDAAGFMAHLSELKFDVKGKNIAILGAGGSTRAILTVLCMMPERPASIRIYNRTASRLNGLLDDLQSRVDLSIVEPIYNINDLDLQIIDVLINATSIGLKKTDPCLVDEEAIHPNMLVYDLIYNPQETLLLKIAKEKGAKVSNGLGMLYYQGVLSLQHWAQVQLSETIKRKMRQSLEKALLK